MSNLDEAGYVWRRKALNAQDVFTLKDSISWSSASGTRDIALNADLGRKLTQIAASILPDSKIVRLTAFNKTTENNWALPWHQDRVVVARKKICDPRFTNWTRKGHYWHCEPPIRFLEEMLFARVYIDNASAETGDIQIAQGSHKFGRIPHGNIEKTLLACPVIQCEGQMGDVLFVKALTLHRSAKTESQIPRRALRVDFSSNDEVIKLTRV